MTVSVTDTMTYAMTIMTAYPGENPPQHLHTS